MHGKEGGLIGLSLRTAAVPRARCRLNPSAGSGYGSSLSGGGQPMHTGSSMDCG
eukprot:CAMPEP_0172328760 /NCGR_PEP_ID=MMETSP1058-20130122/60521_1 /TAXON_ID=83371 /ORGANISM="Detonula confervacea, Strain CCMP 353" /LENGTH=53 /DNA_ID=CAMNT_0013045889 /DNA_START=1457 /DNA_END=1618 /DNA_ORIENTATION=-